MNSISNTGFLLIFSGPSGSGKDTVINEILERDDKTVVSISMTTRSPRCNEVDGVNYYFVTKEQFEEKIKNDEMLEYAKYGDHYYGTPKKPIFKWIDEGKTVILKIEVQGADMIRSRYPDVRTMFLMPPSMHVLKRRLEDRKTETNDEINKLIEIAKTEISRANDYDYIIVNNRLEDTVEYALEAIHRHRCQLQAENESDTIEHL